MKPTTPIEVLFVLMPDSLLLDWSGPAEAFRLANCGRVARGESPLFKLRFIGPRAEAKSSVGATIADIEPFPERLGPRNWVVLCGSPSVPVYTCAAATRETIQWLAKARPGDGDTHLITICSGAILAARAGLLRERAATTHHHHLDELANAERACKVVSNRVFVNDGSIWSSAGVTTGIDLALHLIARECDPALAAQIAQTMVLGVRRSTNDPQISPLLAHRTHLHPAVHRVQDAVSEAPTRTWTLTRMAQISHTSSRHLTRLFIEHTGATPLQYLRTVRLSLAEMSLRAGHSVTRAAEIAGFRSDTQLRRAWHGLGQEGTPSALLRRGSN